MAIQPIPVRWQSGAWLLTLVLVLAVGVSPISTKALELTAPVRVSEGTAAFRITFDLESPDCPPGDEPEVLESTAVLGVEPMLTPDAECGLATLGEDFRNFQIQVPLGGSRTRIHHRITGLLIDDQVPEGCEVFQIRVVDIVGNERVRCRLNPLVFVPIQSGDTARVVIVDDDPDTPLPELSITGGPITEGDSGSGPAVLQVRLSAPSPDPVRVSWTTVDDTATVADGDYEPNGGLLIFDPGETEQLLTIRVFGDRQCEERERFLVQLSVPEGAALASGGDTATVNLDDDDGAFQVDKVSGEGQEGLPGQELPGPLVVRVSDEEMALPKVMVRWIVTAGSATVTPMQATTDGDGQAETRVTLGSEPGTVEVTAIVEEGDCPASSTTFQLGPPPPPGDLEDIPAQGTVAIETVRGVHRIVEQRIKAVRGPHEGSGPRPLSAFGGSVTTSGNRSSNSENEAGFDFDLASFAAGLDAELHGGVLVGGALAYTEGDARLQSGGALDAQAWSGSLFAAWQATLDVHLQGILTWGRQRFSTERVVRAAEGDRLARAKPDGTVWALSLGGGSGGDFGALRVEGFGYLHWVRVEIDRYTETGADDLNLEVFDQRQESLLAEAGVELLYRRGYERWGLALHLGSSFVHELEDDARPITARLVGDPDDLLRDVTDPPDRDYFNLEAGATAKLPGPWSAYLSFHKEVNRDDLETQSLLLGVLFQF